MQQSTASSDRATISLTFDNLGEAFDLLQGKWPKAEAIGSHFTATQVLPKILNDLKLLNLKATFFVEAFNVQYYADQLQDICTQGHEIGLHGWQHEIWIRQDVAEAKKILERSLAAFRSIGVEIKGFRPPGGLLRRDTNVVLEDFGIEYVSPLTRDVNALILESEEEMGSKLLSLPFQWPDVDAFYYESLLAEVREVYLKDRQVLSTTDCQSAFLTLVDAVALSKRTRVVIFHPYLLNDNHSYSVFKHFLETATNNPEIRFMNNVELLT